CAALAYTPPASAQNEVAPASGLSDDARRPWAIGVSAERQAGALRLFQAGHDLFEQGQYTSANEADRQAIAAREHPSIRYNRALALLHLDRPLEALYDLVRALRYGSAPLSPELYAQAQIYQKLLLAQLAQLNVSCAEPGAEVLLDGEPLLVGPGEITRVLAPGAHQLVASKPGYFTATSALTLVAGKVEARKVELVSVQEVRSESRWATSTPWTVLGAGAGLALLGIPVELDAASRMDDFDRRVSAHCQQGCIAQNLSDSEVRAKNGARTENAIAIAMFA